jgi:protein ImuB
MPSPVSAVRLIVSLSERLDELQGSLLEDESAGASGELFCLIDELSSRLGRAAVSNPMLVADPQPECSFRYEPAIHEHADVDVPKESDCFSEVADRLGRPLRLWTDPVLIPTVSVVPEGPPIQFRWLGVEHRVASSWGPERIETGWWRGQDVHRDYYIVETTDGARFWIFRRRDDGEWFLHGCFD